MSDNPQGRITDQSPKCGNCKWYGSLERKERTRQTWHDFFRLEQTYIKSKVNGKGGCMEPSVVSAFFPAVVTDLSLRSLWTPKEQSAQTQKEP